MKAKAAHRADATGRGPERRKQPRKETFWLAQLKTAQGHFECRVMKLIAVLNDRSGATADCSAGLNGSEAWKRCRP